MDNTTIKKRKPKNYVNNRDFYEAIIAYKAKYKEASDSGKELPKLPNYIAHCLTQIANNLAKKPNFAMYPFIDEMINDGILNCIKYFNTFDPNRTNNPFAYFTQTIKNAFILRINTEKKELVTKHKYLHKMSFEGALLVEELQAENPSIDLDNEYMTNLVDSHERKNSLKPKKAKLITKKGLENFYE